MVQKEVVVLVAKASIHCLMMISEKQHARSIRRHREGRWAHRHRPLHSLNSFSAISKALS